MSIFPDDSGSPQKLAELERILQSPIFARSERLGRFLRFTVENALNGKNQCLKEFVIGTEVYDRKPPYHPSQDSIVRTEARRLRSKLKEYYESEGKESSVFISYLPGSYLPIFRGNTSERVDQKVSDTPTEQLFIPGSGVSVGVLPFIDVSGQPLLTTFAKGLTDELIHELMRTDGCRVVAANATVHSGTRSFDIPTLARELGVQIVLEGTVREEGHLVRVIARIVNADGFQITSQRLDAEAESSTLFMMQQQFASAFISRVCPSQSSVRAATTTVTPRLLAIYPHVLKAEGLLEEETSASVQSALAKFQDLTRLASYYSRPFCGIARCHVWMAMRGAQDFADALDPAHEAAKGALQADPKMPGALAAMAASLSLRWSWKESEQYFRRATESGPNVVADRQFASFFIRLGRFDEAWLYLTRAQKIDPFSNIQKTLTAEFFYLSRRYEEAVRHFSTRMGYGPITLEGRLYLALIHAELGNHDQALSIVEEAQSNAGGEHPLRSCIAEIYALNKKTARAKSIATEFALEAESTQLSPFRRARLAAVLGDREMAVAMLSLAHSKKDPETPLARVDPRFDSIRNHTTVEQICKDIRSPQHG